MKTRRAHVLYLVATAMTSVAACAIGIILRRRTEEKQRVAEEAAAFKHALATLEGEGGLVPM